MAFEILPCTLEDMLDVSRVVIEAHRDDPVVSLLLPQSTVAQEAEISFWTACHTREFSKPGRHIFKLVNTESGETVGMLGMHAPYSISQDETGQSGAYADDVPLPLGSHEQLANEFFGKMAAHEAKNLNHQTMYFVNVLAILPFYQRRGLGGLLLKKVMDMADEDGAKIYLESTGAGKALYLRYGWIEFEFFEIDTSPYGGKGKVKMTCMMREPFADQKKRLKD